jgi:hypothetical protein
LASSYERLERYVCGLDNRKRDSDWSRLRVEIEDAIMLLLNMLVGIGEHLMTESHIIVPAIAIPKVPPRFRTKLTIVRRIDTFVGFRLTS